MSPWALWPCGHTVATRADVADHTCESWRPITPPIERESIEDALENDRCGICLSVDHFREDCPTASPAPVRPADTKGNR